MSAEAKFYKHHYAGGVGVGAIEVFAPETLAPGKRYRLVAEHLFRDDGAGGCLAEIECGGGEALLILFGISSLRPDHRRGYRFGSGIPAPQRISGRRIPEQ
jgi:hypothetical protein